MVVLIGMQTGNVLVRVEYDADKPGRLHGFILAADRSKSLEDGWVIQDADGCYLVS